jgi:hypothetical protein
MPIDCFNLPGEPRQGRMDFVLVPYDVRMPFNLIYNLNQYFSGLHLNGGLFYRWPFGIRFDLGGRALTPEDTDEIVKTRHEVV